MNRYNPSPDRMYRGSCLECEEVRLTMMFSDGGDGANLCGECLEKALKAVRAAEEALDD